MTKTVSKPGLGLIRLAKKRMIALMSLIVVTTLAVAACGTTAGGADDELGVGLLYTAGSAQGESLRNGAQLAVDEINEAGGIDGRQVNLLAYDDAADPSEGVRVMQRAVQQDGAEAILGVFSSDVLLALMPWSERLGVPLIGSGGTTEALPQLIKEDPEAYANVFRAGITNSDFLASGSADFARDILADQLGLQTAVLLTEDAAWAESYLDHMESEFEEQSGLEVLDSITVPTDIQDFSSVYSRIAALDADVILTGFAYLGVTPVVQWQQMQPTPYMAGISSQASGGNFFDESGGAAEGVMAWTQASNAPLTEKTQPFVESYTEQFGSSPLFTAFATYDAFHVYKEAVEAAGTAETDAVVEKLEETNYEGVTGNIEFGDIDSDYPHDSKYGDDYLTGVVVQWQGGNDETIWPLRAATAPAQPAP